MLGILKRSRVAELEKELATYKHAYETTRDDRDRLLSAIKQRKSVANVADTLDAGHFRLDFARFKNADPRQTDALAAEWEALYHAGRYDDLQLAILDMLKVRVAHPLGPEYFKPYVTYYLANFHAQRGAYEKTSAYTADIEFSAPPDGTDFLPYALRQGSRLSLFQQQAAMERGGPGIIIISMRKSASAHLSTAIAQGLSLPVLRIGVGEGQHSVAVPGWVHQVQRGGAITHDHMQPLACNLHALRGVGKIWVQLRDPRDAAWSLMNMARAKDQQEREKTAKAFLSTTRDMAEWASGWLTAADEPGMDISFIEYAEFLRSPVETAARIVGHEKAELAAPYLTQKGSNFRSSNSSQWRTAFSTEVCAAADQLIDKRLAERFGWPLADEVRAVG